MSRTFWYVEIEPLAARYTGRLCRDWFPAAFAQAAVLAGGGWRFVRVVAPEVSREIGTGKVLDAVNRGVVALGQVQSLLQSDVKTGDVVYLQDFWTPGIEALLYAWHQTGRRPAVYARNFAQSVDAYDFTYGMRSWMRPVEVGWASALRGMFVASEVHREQLRAAGYACPLHVTGLPFSLAGLPPPATKTRTVAYTSRLDDEKNPWFMLEVAREFLGRHPDWSWVVTTSAARFATEVPGLLAAAHTLAADTGGRFAMLEGLPTDRYLSVLAGADVQFNSALQDYVSFTMLEAAALGCDLCYPAYRSFPECVHPSRLYVPFEAGSALAVLDRCLLAPATWPRAPRLCADGLVAEVAMALTGYSGPEVSVWHQPRASFEAAGLLPA